jgi:Golgi nucleoside diphosphatase
MRFKLPDYNNKYEESDRYENDEKLSFPALLYLDLIIIICSFHLVIPPLWHEVLNQISEDSPCHLFPAMIHV